MPSTRAAMPWQKFAKKIAYVATLRYNLLNIPDAAVDSWATASLHHVDVANHRAKTSS